MERRVIIFSIGAAFLLVLTVFQCIAIDTPVIDNENLKVGLSGSTNTKGDSGIVKISVYHIKKDKTYEKTVKELSKEQVDSLWKELKTIETKGLALVEIFDAKLQILKNYNLISNDLQLNDIIDVNKLNESRYEPVTGENFKANNTPMIFAGGGFGFGFGVPFFVTAGNFLMLLFGFGMTMCYDPQEKVLYSLSTLFFIPMLIGNLMGFMGLILIPVIPGFFYSNLFGIGMAARTGWRLVPSYNQTGN